MLSKLCFNKIKHIHFSTTVPSPNYLLHKLQLSTIKIVEDGDDVIFVNENGETVNIDELDGVYKTQFINPNTKISEKATALHQKARNAGSKGQYTKAIELLKVAHQIEPTWPYPPYDMAYTYLLQDQFDDALTYYEITDKLAPNGFFTSKTAVWSLRNEVINNVFPRGLYKCYISIEWIDGFEKQLSLSQQISMKHPNYGPIWDKIASLENNDLNLKQLAIDTGLKLKNSEIGIDIETEGGLLTQKALLHSLNKEFKESKKILANLIVSDTATIGTKLESKMLMKSINHQTKAMEK